MSLFGSGRREGLFAVLLLLLLSVAAHAPGLFFDLPRNPAGSASWSHAHGEASTNHDVLVPAMQAAARVLADGELPLWNPNSRFGEPFVISGAPLLYPPFWLLMLGNGNGLDLLLCLHTFLAAMCMYRFLRSMPLSRYVGFLGGALYGLGWFMTTQLDRLPDAACAAILPLALEFTRRVMVSSSRSMYAGWLAVVFAAMFATGGTGTAIIGLLLCGTMFLYGLFLRDGISRHAAARSICVTIAFTSLLTAPLWIHSLNHAGSLQPAAERTAPHLQLGGLLGTLSPTAFGPTAADVPHALAMVNPSADPLELVLFPGSVVLFLAVLGLMRPKRNRRTPFWIAVGGIGLLLSIDSPITEGLSGYALGQPINPGITLVLVHIAFVVLAAATLENFFEAPGARPFSVPTTAAIVLVLATTGLALAWLAPSPWRALVASLMETAGASEIDGALPHLRDALLPTFLFSAAIAAVFLAWRRLGMVRFKLLLAGVVLAELLVVTGMNVPRARHAHRDGHLAGRIPETGGRAILAGRDTNLPAPPLLIAGVATVSTTSPAILSRTGDYLQTIDPSMVQVGNKSRVLPLQIASMIDDPLLEVAGVGVVVTTHPDLLTDFVPLAPAPLVENPHDDPTFIQYRAHSPKRARVVFQTIHAGSRREALARLREYTAHPGETVILEGSVDGFTCKRPATEPHITFLASRANAVRLRVDMGQGRGFLRLPDAYAPGWTATIDGVPARIHPADVALRAVAVPEGSHEIAFTYAPMMWRMGFPIALFGILCLAAWLVLSWRRLGVARRATVRGKAPGAKVAAENGARSLHGAGG